MTGVLSGAIISILFGALIYTTSAMTRAQSDCEAATRKWRKERDDNARLRFRAMVLEIYLKRQGRSTPFSSKYSGWRTVLGLSENAKLTKESISAAYKEQAKKAHPDAGGSTAAMAALNLSKAEALKELARAS